MSKPTWILRREIATGKSEIGGLPINNRGVFVSTHEVNQATIDKIIRFMDDIFVFLRDHDAYFEGDSDWGGVFASIDDVTIHFCYRDENIATLTDRSGNLIGDLMKDE